jgi:23S rRNA (pseudouridine1915-N3)-methyltransferase
MISIRLICVGKLKEKFYADAAEEYIKRLSGYCRLDVEELPEARLSERPGRAEIDAALNREAEAVERKIIKGSAVIALCIEGLETDSEGFGKILAKYASDGISKLTFVIGGSVGIHDRIKERADVRLSMSRMTFPHHLARVMLLEQLYRGFNITEGGKYHK